MRKNLDEINKDILDKIDSLDVGDNIKDFLKEALFEEYSHRDENFNLEKEKNQKYEPLINKYFKGE